MPSRPSFASARSLRVRAADSDDARVPPARPPVGRALEAAALVVPAAVALAGAAFLLWRLVPKIEGRPLFVDEVLAGSIALRPAPEVVDIVLWDRGGAPLHFLLAHVALDLSPSPETLRWLSVVFAVATVPLCYDLGRRLAGAAAGATAAAVASASTMLAVYGTIGRMYPLFAFASALAADLFVRALDERTVSAAAAAAVAAWLLPATHPYGLVVVAVEAAVALVVWRGRPLAAGLPVAGVAIAMTPFAVADLQLSERFGVAAGGTGGLASPNVARRYLEGALAGFAGGNGAAFAFFVALGIAGILVLARERPAFAAFACLAMASIPALLLVGTQGGTPRLSPRHLIFGLPLWAALVGAGVARGIRGIGRIAGAAAVVAVAAIAVLAPNGTGDPRVARNATTDALERPARWVGDRVAAGDLLFPASPVFLSALPATREAPAIPLTGRPLRMLERLDYPVGSVFVALPLPRAAIDEVRLASLLPDRFEARAFRYWLLLQANGPYPDRASALAAFERGLAAARDSTTPSAALEAKVDGMLRLVCRGLRRLGEPCRAPPAT